MGRKVKVEKRGLGVVGLLVKVGREGRGGKGRKR